MEERIRSEFEFARSSEDEAYSRWPFRITNGAARSMSFGYPQRLSAHLQYSPNKFPDSFSQRWRARPLWTGRHDISFSPPRRDLPLEALCAEPHLFPSGGVAQNARPNLRNSCSATAATSDLRSPHPPSILYARKAMPLGSTKRGTTAQAGCSRCTR